VRVEEQVSFGGGHATSSLRGIVGFNLKRARVTAPKQRRILDGPAQDGYSAELNSRVGGIAMISR
jgi:hypothetical protein